MSDAEFREWLAQTQGDANTQADTVVQYLSGKFEGAQLERIAAQLCDIAWTRNQIPF